MVHEIIWYIYIDNSLYVYIISDLKNKMPAETWLEQESKELIKKERVVYW